jgi:hypothetical protein
MKLYVKLLTGDLLTLDIPYAAKHLTVKKLRLLLLDQYPSYFQHRFTYLLHLFYEKLNKNGDLSYMPLSDEISPYLTDGEILSLVVNEPKPIVLYEKRDGNENTPWYVEIGNVENNGPYSQLHLYIDDDDLEKMYSEDLKNPQLVIDYDTLRYHFEPDDVDMLSVNFYDEESLDEFVCKRLYLSFMPPGVDDYDPTGERLKDYYMFY